MAERVIVESRSANAGEDEAVRWESAGEADFEVETISRAERGTSITLYLQADDVEFADAWRVKSVIKKYADHISVPVLMLEEPMPAMNEGEIAAEDAEPPVAEYQPINSAKALWTRSRSEIEDEEYQEFYNHISHDFAEPLTWSHNRVEGKLDYISLIYIPSKAPFDMWQRDTPRGVKLYVQRVFIMDEAEQFLPLYLRFVKGVVDSNDLPLNVSREILQSDPSIDSMKSALTKRALDSLEKLAKNDAEKYQTFWQEFGQVLKRGPCRGFREQGKIAGLLRFATTNSESETQNQSLKDYIERMTEGQDKIYYVAADNYHTAKNSPHLEVFAKKGIEVLLLNEIESTSGL